MNFLKKIFLISCLVAGLLHVSVAADPIPETACREDNHTQTAIFMVPQGQYQVYVSTDRGNDIAQVYINQFNDLNVAHCENTASNVTD